ncbi:hypothetical protein Vretimale_665 [Volvox reticuliferus]|uniref:CMP/dCMP-type deaminase domain-containing protein n=1 Tax=Volvox reticuliferus TaxID=1737510 RepID=A0A8J4FH39_9CHLO|nr:hypothetical protein Vretifemale_2335 [Volvox reticuliferus]GIL94466.1 hypothetical protein Vretimale_665 [Volvox reticuliferus]
MAPEEVAFEMAVLVPSQTELPLKTALLAVAAFPNKVGNLLMKALSAAAPLAELKHLKRVRKAPDDGALLEAILCALDDAGVSEAAPTASTTEANGTRIDTLELDRLPASLQALYTQHGGQRLRLVHGAALAPQTRQQWETWTKLWPITWRIPDNGTPVLVETPVDELTQQYYERYMRTALQLASLSGVDNAAVIVDPVSAAPVAEAADKSAFHPLQHAVMAAVQAASERDLALWPPGLASVDPYSNSGVDAMGDTPGANGSGEETATQRQPHGESTPTPDFLRRGMDGGDTGTQDTGGDDDACEGLACKRQRLDTGPQEPQASARSRPYMCTGYDCFVIREPCIMCAMALVHSRVQRVIYCQPDATFGALGGCRRLHACKSLNHSYEVYRLGLKQEL